jgi:hypothetical protein
MKQQTAVEWLASKLSITFQTMYDEEIKQAKAMERAQRVIDYNAGYVDGQLNHVNDSENYVYESEYLKNQDNG